MPHELSRVNCRPQAGERFAVGGQDYVLEGKIGNGAAGLVRRARRLIDQQEFAVKFLAPDPKYIEEEVFDDVRARFKREGERGAQLEHDGLLKIHAYSDNPGGAAFAAGYPKNPFLLMDRAPGGTVEEYLQRLEPSLRHVVTVDEARLQIAIQTAEALDYLHKRRIVHRDIKPSNLFLTSKRLDAARGRVLVGDFGVVKWGDFHASLTTGSLTATMHRGLGTLKYMSPEQALRPKDVDSKSDVFSFGITLFELFSGQILPSFHHVFEVMMARDSQGTPVSRMRALQLSVEDRDLGICELILEMVRKGTSRRPSIQSVRGRLIYEYERRFDREWRHPSY